MLSRKSERIYLDPFDVNGVLNILADRIREKDENLDIYLGAHEALNLIRTWPQIDKQQDFMRLFDYYLQGYLDDLKAEGEKDEEDQLE